MRSWTDGGQRDRRPPLLLSARVRVHQLALVITCSGPRLRMRAIPSAPTSGAWTPSGLTPLTR